jgi:NTP pyrophosphatase (non-canonical NTP hydrolase)
MNLTLAQIERLNLLQEECAETIQAASKVLRFGYEGSHPKNKGLNNKEHLEEEIGNVCAILTLMSLSQDIDEEECSKYESEKLKTIGKYTNHQEEKDEY